jgi:hypothetical protein
MSGVCRQLDSTEGVPAGAAWNVVLGRRSLAALENAGVLQEVGSLSFHLGWSEGMRG